MLKVPVAPKKTLKAHAAARKKLKVLAAATRSKTDATSNTQAKARASRGLFLLRDSLLKPYFQNWCLSKLSLVFWVGGACR
jgi:hypothetical protein